MLGISAAFRIEFQPRLILYKNTGVKVGYCDLVPLLVLLMSPIVSLSSTE